MKIDKSLPGWLKWGSAAIVIILLICLISAAVLYSNIHQERTEAFAETEKVLLEATSLQQITDIKQFNGAESYHVVFGVNEENEEKIIYYPLGGREKNLTTVDRSEIITQDKVVEEWKSRCMDCKLVQIVPSLIDGEELWEITYWDESGRYVFDYVSIYDGSPYEMYRLNPMFE
ncbi:cell wall elongation regulator TseB-like domain-containing protein [Virgibacillus sediminis]|uniref:DUF5590 domain-containing protein n=1 Tax=Virgibacillus sediminis TaxID=202260 RepID=A0ABV7A629_9BACI